MIRALSASLLFAIASGCGTNAAPLIGGSSDVFILGDASADGSLPDVSGSDTPLADVGVDVPSTPDIGEGECVPNSTECDGNVLLTCAADGSAVGRTRCAARGLVCVESNGGAACADSVCEPGESTCVSDTESAECNELGGGFLDAEFCDEGCDFDTGRCAGSVPIVECTEFDVEEIGPGTYFFDLCDATDTAEHVEQNDCNPGGAESGGDGIFSITVERETDIYLDLRDEDGSAAIDTIMYLRTACDDPESQIDCSDDVPCDESDVPTGDCSGGLQVRQSRISRTLDPGRYYLWIDHLNYRRFGCGDVRLIVEY